MYIFVEYPKCSTCQRARKWLEGQGVEFTSRHILEENPTREELAAWVEEALGLPQNYVRHLPQAGPETVCRVAVCGGAGSDFLGEAVNAGCQAYLTGEVRRHEYLEAERRGLLLLDGGHFATENVAMPVLREQLAKALPEVEVRLSRQATDQRPQALPPRG